MRFFTIIAILLGAFSGFLYSNGLPSISENLTIFYIITIVSMPIFLIVSPKNTHFFLKDFLLGDNNKFLGYLSSFAMFAITLLSAYYVYINNLAIYMYILPVLSLVTSISFAGVTKLLKKGVMSSTLQSMSTAPIFLLTAELLLTFRDGSTNPILADFVITLLAVASGIIMCYVFSTIICTKETQVFLNGFIAIFWYFVFALAFALGTSYYFQSTSFDYSFENLRVLCTLFAIGIFMSQYSKILLKKQ